MSVARAATGAVVIAFAALFTFSALVAESGAATAYLFAIGTDLCTTFATSALFTECAVVGASGVALANADACTQCNTILTVIVCRTHFAVNAFYTYTASNAEPSTCVALCAAEIAYLNIFLSAAVAKSYKLLVFSAVTTSLALVTVGTEIIAASTRLVTPTADSCAFLAGRTIFTEYKVVVSALCAAIFFLEITAIATILTSVAVPAQVLRFVAALAFVFSTITVFIAAHTNFAEVKVCVLTTADSTLFVLFAGMAARGASVTVLADVFLSTPATFATAVLAYGSAIAACTAGVTDINATFAAHAAFLADFGAVLTMRIAKTARRYTTNAEIAVVTEIISCTAKCTGLEKLIGYCASH